MLEDLSLNNAALQRYGHGVGSIIRRESHKNLTHVSLDDLFRDLEMIGDDPIGIPRSYLPQGGDFAFTKRIVGVMFCQIRRRFREGFSFARRALSESSQPILSAACSQKIAVGACFKRSVILRVAAIGGHDDPGIRKLLTDCENRFTPTHERHL
jgi:hypothetical protein